ncbi:MAG TPA: flagellar brake protein [Noviherbaspirillum sp.]|nr:flagellar brake protein [Noviherbaspirillum sp.]
MAKPPVSLLPVRVGDLVVGKPLQRAVYDSQGNLLLASGRTIESQSQLAGLIQHGFIQDTVWEDFIHPTAPKNPVLMGATKRPAPAASAAGSEGAPNATKDVSVGMDDIKWHVGETLYLQPADNTAVRYTVRLIGFVKNGTVFVTAPMVDGKLEFIREGQAFVVRAFSGKKAYAFICAAVKSMHTPHPYLHLSYPKDVRCTLVRSGARAAVKIAASVSLGEPERNVTAVLLDLSVGGTSGVVKQAFGEKGETGQIKFKVNAAGQDELLNLKTVLRSVAPSDNGDGFKHGFEFLDVSTHDRLILSAFVHQTLAEGN